jgi:hypothetical protein
MSVVKTSLAALTLAFASSMLVAVPAAAQSPPLTGERFDAGPPLNSYGPNFTCDPTTGAFHYTDGAFQSATGPYPGDFLEQGSGTIGTVPDANGRTQVLSFTAQFEVPHQSTDPAVTGTKTFVPGFSSGESSLCNPDNNAALLSAENLVYVAQLPDGTVDVGLSSITVGGDSGGHGPLTETFTSVSSLGQLVGNGPGQSLQHKIDHVVAALQQGDLAGMCNGLASLSNEAQAQRGKHLSAAEADALIAAIQGIRLAVGGC